MEIATKQDFKKAPLGHPFLECCPGCHTETGSILIKSEQRTRDPISAAEAWKIPKHIEGGFCEFCYALASWIGNERDEDVGIEEIKEVVRGQEQGVAKLVKVNEDGEEKTVAFIPFTKSERTLSLCSDDGELSSVKLDHGTVVRGVPTGEGSKGLRIVEVIREGVKL